ncbi:exodeoxyribonuclease VII large subunit [candidate division NPL-UPA2 bacterium]|nr:exodeoxyribonuclease VII large subunit [candidate division NPL-UPA2 bacterium]
MPNEEERRVYTVTELTRSIKSILEKSFPEVWVEGEVSNLRIPSSGHMYFTLKDESAELHTVMFRGLNQYLRFKMEDGLMVVAFGIVSVYQRRGEYQLVVEKLEPRGLGALQLAFEQLKKKLEEEGLFDEAHKKPVPFLPIKIGVVTSSTGAAIRDIINVVQRRFSNVEILVNPVRVQGEGAAQEIARAIDELNEMGEVEVMIVGRGGGSLEDLWAFNEEVVARAIYRSQIPVISAVGHEIDYTIADFVADLRAPTPSAAAELVIVAKEELVNRIEVIQSRMKSGVLNTLTLLKNRLSSARESYAFRRPKETIQQYQQRIDDLARSLAITMDHLLELSRERVARVAGKLETLSPLGILSRGYSISLKLPERAIIRRAAALKAGDEVETMVKEGSFLSRVR